MLDKQYDWKSIEQAITEAWTEKEAFSTQVNPEGEPYCIIMPPANVTGNLHLGHALTFTIQDVLIRFHRMLGKNVLWQPGTDHAGIATQIVVERHLKEEGLSRHDLGREAFIDRVWNWKAQSGGAIVSQLKRLGASADWSRERFTMDDASNKAVTKVFVTLYHQGLIYRDKRLVNWDCQMQSAISDLEVTQKETPGSFYYIRYPFKSDASKGLIVATTRPETLFGDMAVAVHPEHPDFQDLIGEELCLPLTSRTISVIGDEYSDPEKGTGAVKITPAHDFNDFEVGKRHGLEFLNILTPEGMLNDQVPEAYQGLTVQQAREKVVADLEAQGLLVKVEEMTHAIPLSERTGMVIEPYLTDQWFVDTKKLAEQAISAVESNKTVFIPEKWRENYFDWMRNILPWCISRQIWWGHQIPVWYGPDQKPFVAETYEEAVSMAERHYGTPTTLYQDPDVLDTWFSSALWPFVTLGWPENTSESQKYYPTSVLVTGFDILFFWVARMMMMGTHFMGDVPFRDVYIHALVGDKNGQKMSKSKGNVLDPLNIMDQYGTDALRFTLASMASPGRDVKFSEQKVESARNFVTKLWNASRYVLMTEASLDPAFDPLTCQEKVNQWVVASLDTLVEEVTKHLHVYEINVAAQKVYHFIWGVFCDWYLELTKPLLKEGSQAVQLETQKTLAWALHRLLQLLHPFMPFVTEAIAEALGGQSMLIVSKWPKPLNVSFEGAQQDVDWLLEMIKAVRGVKAEVGIKPGALVKLFYQHQDAQIMQRWADMRSLFQGLGRIEELSFLEETQAQTEKCLQVLVRQDAYFMPVEGLFDVEAELMRLEKQLDKKTKELTGLSKRLANADFVARAPADVVSEAQQQLADLEAAIEKTKSALKSLANLKHDAL